MDPRPCGALSSRGLLFRPLASGDRKMPDFELTSDQIASAIRWREQGFSADQGAELGTAAGWSQVETMKLLKKYFDVGLGEGKTMVDRLQDPGTRKANDFLRYQAELVLRFPEEATEADIERMESITGWNMKLWALVQADRYEDIEAALDRFDPQAMMFPAMSLYDARELVLSEISSWEVEMKLRDAHTTEYDFGWTFVCQSLDFIRTGNFLDMAVGIGPFLVDKFTGVMWRAGSAFSTEVSVANYRGTGNPLRPRPT